MNKKFFVSWIVMFIVAMAGGFIVHGVLLGADYAKLVTLFRPEADAHNYFPYMLLAHVMLSGAFVWIYARGLESKPWLGQGLRFGIIVALLTVIPTYIIYYAVQPMPSDLVVKQILFDTVWMLLQGAVVAFLYRNVPRA